MRDPLISASDLQALLGAPDLRVLDASWYLDGRDGRALYEQAHIPGAGFFDIDAISDHASPLPHMLPAAEAFGQAMGALGVGRDDRIVVYDQQGLFSAARSWWSLRAMGAGRVQVLDGGLPAWRASGGAVEGGVPTVQATTFEARFNPAFVRDFEQVRQNIETKAFQLIDARSSGRFDGTAPEPRAGVRSGHAPGSLNLPFAQLLEADGRMKPPQALAEAFRGVGADLERPITTTCGSGVTAAILALALARLGKPDVPIYDGAWAEWGSRPDAVVLKS